MKTIKSYKKTILRKYEKGGSEYLTALSPAKIRYACLLKFENGLDKEDLNTFARFFNFEENATYLENVKKIEVIDIDKFRPFKNFLKRITEDTLNKNAELIAVLVDFKPRPYNNYRKQQLNNGYSTVSTFKEESNLERLLSKLEAKNRSKKNFEGERKVKIASRINLKKTLFIVSGFFILVFFMRRYTALKNDLKKATIINCIVWTDNLYKEDSFNYLSDLTTNTQVISLLKARANDSGDINSTEIYIRCFQHQGILYFGIIK